MSRIAPLLVALALLSCSTPGEGPPPPADEASETAPEPSAPIAAVPASGPHLLAVGTAQDGGLPHVACSGANCRAARRDPSRRRYVASLAIVLPESGRIFLIDATPDIHEQIDLLAGVRGPAPDGVDRAPIDGVFLTHAHIGHYLGLALFGYEAVHTKELPVWGTARMVDFLRGNGPWSLLVDRRNIDPRTIDRPVRLGDGVSVAALAVPHRDEFTDTVGFVIEGPSQRVLYVPDTDSWRAWQPAVEETLATFDVAIVDGTFFSTDELPGRSVEEIGHPLIADSLERLSGVIEGGSRVVFTHFNHSNPVVDPESTARQRVLELGFELLDDGNRIEL